MIALLVLVAIGAAAAIAYRPWARTGRVASTEKFYTIIPMDMDIKVSTRGELQAARYTDVENKVEGVTTITSLAKEGEIVEKGQVICQLDSTNLEQRKESLDLDVKKADSAVIVSEQLLNIQKMQNATNEEAADVAVQLAELDKKQYEDGTYTQQLQTAELTLEMAKTLLKNKEEDLDQTKSLYAKGFVTGAEVKKSELDVIAQRNEVQKATTALRVFKEYTDKMQRKQLESTLAQARQRLERTKRQSISYLAQCEADLNEKRTSQRLLHERSEKLRQQLESCTIRAPEAGMLVYMSSIYRDMREPIQEGASVRWSQTLFRLPDVRTMKALCKVQEAQKLKLKEGEQRAIIRIMGVPNPVGALLTKVAPLPDTSQRWINPDAKEYPIELLLDETPPNLKPGTGAEIEILISHLEKALAVPMSAIYSTGSDAYVFVRDGDGLKPHKVTLGVNNDTHVQLLDGVAANDQVLLLQAGQGRDLLEKAGIKVEEAGPTSRPTWGGKSRRGGGQRPSKPPAAAAAPAAAKAAVPVPDKKA